MSNPSRERAALEEAIEELRDVKKANRALLRAIALSERWEYGVSVDGREPTPVWDEYPGDEARANLEDGDDGVKLVRRIKAGPWRPVAEGDNQ